MKNDKVLYAFFLIVILFTIGTIASGQDVKKDLKVAKKADRHLQPNALELYQKVLDSPNFKTLMLVDQLEVYDRLAGLYFSGRNYQQAENNNMKAIEMREKHWSNSQISASDRAYFSLTGIFYEQSLSYLGRAQLQLKKYEDARRNLTRALEINEKFNSSDDLRFQGLAAIAKSYYQQGKYAEAKPYYVRAIAAPFYETHFETSDVVCDLANINREEGLFAIAELQYQRAIRIMEWYEKDSKGVLVFDNVAIRNLREYAKLLRKTDRTEEAIKLEAKANLIANNWK